MAGFFGFSSQIFGIPGRILAVLPVLRYQLGPTWQWWDTLH